MFSCNHLTQWVFTLQDHAEDCKKKGSRIADWGFRIADFRFVLRTPTLRAGSRFQIEERSIKWVQQDNYMFLLPSRNCVAIRHPGQVRLGRTRAGIQKEFDYKELLLDSGSRSAERSSSGMTGLVNCDIVSKRRKDFCGAKLINVFKS